MKKNIFKILCGIFVVIIILSCFIYSLFPIRMATDGQKIKYFILFEGDSGKIVYDVNTENIKICEGLYCSVSSPYSWDSETVCDVTFSEDVLYIGDLQWINITKNVNKQRIF